MLTSPTRPPRLITRPMLLVFLAGLCSMTSFYLLLSVVPLYATAGGAGQVGAGATTAALMVTTVIGELGSSRLVARLGYRLVYAVGLVLLGAPVLLLLASSSLSAIIGVSLLRGFGFAIAVVTGSALVAAFAPPQRRGEGLGIYGVVVGVPSIIALPLGVWLASHVGYPPVFIAAAVAALGGAAASAGLPGRTADAERGFGIRAALRNGGLTRPALVFFAIATASGAVATFLPLALTARTAAFIAVALLVQSAASTLARWSAGRLGDRRGSARLIGPSVILAAAGMFTLVLLPRPAAVIIAMVLFGVGFGVAQNASAAVMFDRAEATAHGTVSALWNLAYDAGIGVGAAGFGLVTVHTGHRWAFALTGVAIALTLLVVWRDRRACDGGTG